MRKKILFVCGSTQIGGAEIQIVELISRIREFANFRLIILGNEEEFGYYLSSKKIDFVQIKNKKIGNLYQFFRLFREIKGYQPDILCTWLYRADILAGLAGKISGVERIVTCLRNSKWPGFKRWKKLALIFCNRFIFDAAMANSDSAASWHSSIGYKGKISVIPNYLRSLHKQEPLPFNGFHKPLRIGILSRPVRGKGHETLLEAVAVLQSKGVPVTAYFMGFGITKWTTLKDKIHTLDLADSVVLSEGSTNISSWFNEIDIYIMGSESWESDSNSLIEAISMHKPCIISSLLVNDNFDPPLESFKSGDSSSLIEAIEIVMNETLENVRKNTGKRKASLKVSRLNTDLTVRWITFLFSEQETLNP